MTTSLSKNIHHVVTQQILKTSKPKLKKDGAQSVPVITMHTGSNLK